jgi:hypothetical protein
MKADLDGDGEIKESAIMVLGLGRKQQIKESPRWRHRLRKPV